MSDAPIGVVQSIDTGNATIKVSSADFLNTLQVNQLVWIRSTRTNEKIIGIVVKILSRAIISDADIETKDELVVENIFKANLVGTWVLKVGDSGQAFSRSLSVVPSVGAEAFVLGGKVLTDFMGVISSNAENPLQVGHYVIAEDSKANLDGNKFFQRHAVIVGGTGSGKSWTVASILEQASKLASVNGIVFDIHGEYAPLHTGHENMTLLKIAGPADEPTMEGVLFLPYWLLSYDEIESLLLDRSDQNAPNQARMLFDGILKYKRLCISNVGAGAEFPDITVESPFPYDIDFLLAELIAKDEEMVPGVKSDKQGPLHGKLTRFIQRLKSKRSDKRLNFLFNQSESLRALDWFGKLANTLIGFGNGKGLKIIDFSEVPSDILPLITGLVARLIFDLQHWMPAGHIHPIAMFCDEAHLYVPNAVNGGIEESSLHNFERIAKEGRKYGVALIVISQRPADVNKTVLSQCGNFVAMRLSNPDDQNVIRRLFPDSLGNFAEVLPILDVGEALIVGDACLLPSRVKISPPSIKPNSATIDFWDEWSKIDVEPSVDVAVKAYRKQQRICPENP